MSEEKIYRLPVIGYAVTVTESKRVNSEPHFNVRILTLDWQGYCDDGDGMTLLSSNSQEERLVSVIPAAPGTYQVMGIVDEEDLEDLTGELLGYEFPGAYRPDWEEVRQQKLREKASPTEVDKP